MTAATISHVGDAELHTLPNGTQVVYRDRDHSYWQTATAGPSGVSKCSGRLTGVSTVVAPFDWRPDNLMKWAARLNGEGIAALAAEGLSLEEADDMRAALSFLQSGDSIWQALADGKLLYSQARDEAADRGTNVHKHALHRLATGARMVDLAALTPEEQGYARGVMGFWHECEPVAKYAEQVVLHPDLGVAGRLDLICDLTWNGLRYRDVVVDAKTSGFIPTKHHVQISGYEDCALECGLLAAPPEIGFILQVTATGGYDLIPVTATRDDFHVAVDLYRRAARIGREAGAARRAQEALAA
jgi:hypothetical protein